MPNNINWISFLDFSGGENVDADADNLAENEVATCENIDLSINGGFKSRLGCGVLNSTSYGEQVEQLFEWKKYDGSVQLMAKIGNTLYLVDGSGNTTLVKNLSSSSPRKIWWFSFQTNLYFGDGTDFYYYNETTVYSVEAEAPTAAPTLAGSGTGTLSGLYSGKVTFVNEAGNESQPSPAGSTGTLSNALQINWSNIPTGPANTVSRKLYRTKGDGSYYYLVATISDNTTTTYTDTTKDSGLTEMINIPEYISEIQKCRMATYHDKSYRWFFAGNPDNPTALFWSKSNEPTVHEGTAVLYPVQGMGAITALAQHGDALIVFYQYGAYIWRGIDPATDAIWTKIPIPEGTESPYSIVLTPSSMTYLGRGGLWMLPPQILNYQVAMEASGSLVPNIAYGKQVKTITSISSLPYACSVYVPETGYLMMAYTKTAGSGRNDRVLICRWGANAFWHYTGWIVNDWCLRANGDLLFASENYIMKANTGTNDNGAAIEQIIKCKKTAAGAGNNYKVLGKMLINAAQRSEASTVDVEIKSEDSSLTKEEITLNEVTTWSGKWSGAWGAPAELTSIEINFDSPLTGKRFQVIFSNDRKDEAITIYNYSLGHVAKRPIGKRV